MKKLFSLTLLCLAFSTMAFSGLKDKKAEPSSPPEFITVTGTIVQGFECLILLPCDELNYYPLQGNLHNFQVGDVVEIKGKVIDGAFCLSPGATGIQIQRIHAATCE